MLESVDFAAIENVWSKQPRSYQIREITTIIKMHCKGEESTSILLVQVTGTGKFTVPKTVGVITCGVTLVLENTLSLGADQSSKFINVSQNYGPVIAYQLESLLADEYVKSINSILFNLQTDTNVSVFIYSSPEKLLLPTWSNMINQLIINKTLKMICIDEVHNFFAFASSFRTEIFKLKTNFFKKIKYTSNKYHLRVTLLIMKEKITIDLVQSFNKSVVYTSILTTIFWLTLRTSTDVISKLTYMLIHSM